ncbi:FAD-dependent oxidoreductase [Ferruginibacter sp. SUN106]|uniref:FAD-dependent oxidoreductase n=1 Tax=Ferruginibacter sp. SUN106 TaxID=2978348 RepID=UPI003D366593
MQRKHFLKLAMLTNMGLVLKPRNIVATSLLKNAMVGAEANVLYYKKGSTEYETLRKGFNKRIDKYPAIIALCKNTQGVSEAILYAKQNNLPVAVKSGGHCMEGFSCNNGGMVINLSLLNTIEWVDKETIIVGPGCTLSNIYDVILPKGRIIPGGSCAGVGIGGLVLGGGYGLLGRKFGLTCDSLLEVTMVDGNGVIRNSKDDKELLWACKGGGNGNFGVVTALRFKTHKAPATLQSFRFKTYKADTAKAKSILQKWFELTATLPVDCFSAYVLNGKTVYILLTNAGKHTAEVQNVITALSAVSGKTTKTKPQQLSPALKVFYGRREPLHFKNASAGLYKNFAEIESYIDKAIDTVLATPGMIYQVNTLGGNIQNKEFEAAASFPHRAFPYFSELQTYWENEKQSIKLLQKFQEVQNIFTTNGIHTQYRNYPDINFKNWDTLYYGSNYTKLQQLKNKYDPGNIIRHDQSIKNG